MTIGTCYQGNAKSAIRLYRRLGAWLFAACSAICVGGCLSTPLAAGSFVKSVEEDHGTYYRLKVKLTYKGEPQDFDIVVGCNVRRINYKDNSSTYEAGLVPTVFGRRMTDGKGLVIRAPDACDGQTTANGRVQSDLLPVVVVYDDAETLTFGIAYLSEDAYDSPLSVLTFGGATVEKATRAEFDEFRRTQPNLVKRESYHAPLDSDTRLKANDFTYVTRPFGHQCQAYMRFRIPEELRPQVRKQWPKARPTYWRPDTYEAERAITSEIWGRAQILTDRASDPPRRWDAYMELSPERTADLGLATRTGGGLISRSRGNLFPPSIYPATDDYQAHRWPADWAQWTQFLAAKNVAVRTDVDFRDGRLRGFAYCSTLMRLPVEEQRVWGAIREKPPVSRVDGHDVISKRPASDGLIWIFQRDDYVFRIFEISLESTRGDV